MVTWNVLQRFAAALRAWLRNRQQSKYRPERHYMRGPGPKSRERAGAKSC